MHKNLLFLKAFTFILFIWIVFILQDLRVIPTQLYATSKENGIISVFTGVFLHGNLNHLISNTSVLLFALPILLKFYRKSVDMVMILGMFIPSFICYLLNMSVLGISGLVFTIVSFILFAGLSSNNVVKFIVSFFIALFFSRSLLVGITPMAGLGIAWQAHLAGFMLAAVLAVYRNITIK